MTKWHCSAILVVDGVPIAKYEQHFVLSGWIVLNI